VEGPPFRPTLSTLRRLLRHGAPKAREEVEDSQRWMIAETSPEVATVVAYSPAGSLPSAYGYQSRR
jgi:hypothetical protein